MATTRSKSPKSRLSYAEIRIDVIDFRDVLDNTSTDCRGTNYALKLVKRHPLVYIKEGFIHVRSPGATIRFTIASARGDKGNYFPMGITFVREGLKNANDQQRLGLLNFPQQKTRVFEKIISITDTYRDGKEVVKYKFSVIIQRGSDGKIGIIDPGILHDSSDARGH